MFNVIWNDIITVEIAVNCDPPSGTLVEPSMNTCIPTTPTPTQTMVQGVHTQAAQTGKQQAILRVGFVTVMTSVTCTGTVAMMLNTAFM